ncbi:MAG: cupin domain-containing protein [Burkholderiaceae bacterium]
MSTSSSDESSSEELVRRAGSEFAWQGVTRMAYKADGEAPFRDVSRQVLFDDASLGCQWRYFEVGPGGHSTLERHQHVHAVMILRGAGRCLLGDRIHSLATHDLVSIPPMTWHQFRADADRPLGFLCLVRQDRDRPLLPDHAELARLRSDPAIAAFLDE